MSKVKYLVAALSLTLLGLFGVARVIAEAPTLVSYQGRLTDPGGATVTDTFSILFTIYNDSVASAPSNVKWQETQANVVVVEGIFSVLLGINTPLADTVFKGLDRYLGIKVGGDPEIAPRTRIASVPYSQRIATIDNSRGGDVFDTIRIVAPSGYTGIEMFSRPETTTIRFYEPVSVKSVNQPLRVELNDTAFLMFPHTGLAQPVDTNVKVAADGTVRSIGTIAVGEETDAPGKSAASFGAADTAFGDYSIVAGGQNNQTRGKYALAAGRNAKALHAGSFVWADTGAGDYSSTNPNTFNIRAENGLILSRDAGHLKNISQGNYYRDNSIVAWGRVADNGTIGTDQFGIANVVRDSDGIYTIDIDAVAVSPNELIPFACVVVNAPPTNPFAARFIYVDQIDENTFKVYITHGNYALIDNEFVFMVTAR